MNKYTVMCAMWIAVGVVGVMKGVIAVPLAFFALMAILLMED